MHDEISLSNQHAAVVRLDDERKAIGMPIYTMETKSGVSINSRSASMPNLVAVAETLGFEVVLRLKR